LSSLCTRLTCILSFPTCAGKRQLFAGAQARYLCVALWAVNAEKWPGALVLPHVHFERVSPGESFVAQTAAKLFITRMSGHMLFEHRWKAKIAFTIWTQENAQVGRVRNLSQIIRASIYHCLTGISRHSTSSNADSLERSKRSALHGWLALTCRVMIRLGRGLLTVCIKLRTQTHFRFNLIYKVAECRIRAGNRSMEAFRWHHIRVTHVCAHIRFFNAGTPD
jgi:hypothetical protein